MFDPRTAFLGNDWGAGKTAAALIRAGEITAPVMVGIYNLGHARMHEYAPTRAEFPDWEDEKTVVRSKGDAKRYARFVVNELKPFIDSHYLTVPGPSTTAVVGSSMGGLVSLYFALWHPRVFGHVGALSPSVWWDDRVVVRDFAALRKRTDVRLWLDMGTAEPGWETVQLLRDALVARGWIVGDDLRYGEVSGGEHTEKAWAKRIGPLLKFFLGREKPRARKPTTSPRKRAMSATKSGLLKRGADVDIW